MKYRYIIPVLALGIGLGDFNDRVINQSLVYAEKKQEKQSTPFKKAEEYHIKAKFEDARNWYSMVVNDFPETKEAAESSFRRFVIDFAEIKFNLVEGGGELEKAINYLEEAQNYYSDFKYEILKKANYHEKNAQKFRLLNIKIVEGQFLNDFLNLKDYLKKDKDIDALKILDEVDKNKDSQMLDLDEVARIVNYNFCVGELSTEKKVDDLKVRFIGGSILYGFSENTTEKGKKELEDIIKETENEPYNEVRYEVQKALKEEPRWKIMKKMGFEY